jgi:SSS family solute:Na+ symporter
MQFGTADIVVFVAFVATVLIVGISKSRHEKTGEDYFLAGRGLVWWLIGFSLIAANISTEQFVGMSGNAASHVGLAIASYEWMAAITLVVIAFAFLVLKLGFIRCRNSSNTATTPARGIMASQRY